MMTEKPMPDPVGGELANHPAGICLAATAAPGRTARRAPAQDEFDVAFLVARFAGRFITRNVRGVQCRTMPSPPAVRMRPADGWPDQCDISRTLRRASMAVS
jgi:hypothetical protein